MWFGVWPIIRAVPCRRAACPGDWGGGRQDHIVNVGGDEFVGGDGDWAVPWLHVDGETPTAARVPTSSHLSSTEITFKRQ